MKKWTFLPSVFKHRAFGQAPMAPPPAPVEITKQESPKEPNPDKQKWKGLRFDETKGSWEVYVTTRETKVFQDERSAVDFLRKAEKAEAALEKKADKDVEVEDNKVPREGIKRIDKSKTIRHDKVGDKWAVNVTERVNHIFQSEKEATDFLRTAKVKRAFVLVDEPGFQESDREFKATGKCGGCGTALYPPVNPEDHYLNKQDAADRLSFEQCPNCGYNVGPGTTPTFYAASNLKNAEYYGDLLNCPECQRSVDWDNQEVLADAYLGGTSTGDRSSWYAFWCPDCGYSAAWGVETQPGLGGSGWNQASKTLDITKEAEITECQLCGRPEQKANLMALVLNGENQSIRWVCSVCAEYDLKHNMANPANRRTLNLTKKAEFEEQLALARNPSTTSEQLVQLLGTGDLEVDWAVAENPNTPAAALRQLATHKRWSIRALVAENPNVYSELLDYLSNDDSSDVRLIVAANSKTSVKTLNLLREDPDDRVRAVAIKTLRNAPVEETPKINPPESEEHDITHEEIEPHDIEHKDRSLERYFEVEERLKIANEKLDIIVDSILTKITKEDSIEKVIAAFENDIMQAVPDQKEYALTYVNEKISTLMEKIK